jgi:hypothetical protein
MAQPIDQERFTAELFAVLKETFEQTQGIYLDSGTSLFETLAQISAAEASRPVSGRCASIAAQVAHVTFYLDVLERFLRTRQNEKADWGDIWRRIEAVTPEAWANSQQELKQAYQRVLETLRNLEDWGAGDNIGGALGIVAHTAYHLGEIRQALCVIK